jgi:hypothetical protein
MWASVLLLFAGAARAVVREEEPLPPTLILSNDAVEVKFSAVTGELMQLTRKPTQQDPLYLTSSRVERDSSSQRRAVPYLTQKPPPQQQPFCVEGPSPASWYIKVGGDETKKSGWSGPPLDRCCRAKDASGGKNCRWYRSQSACVAALPGWQALCLSCAAQPTPLGCPTFGGGGLPPSPSPGAAGEILMSL